MEKKGLILNKSYENFVLGDDIANYLHLPHDMTFHDDPTYSIPGFYDVYYFDKVNFGVWVEDGKIVTISCDVECYWQGENLINMKYDDFLDLINHQEPNSEEVLYVPVSRGRGQNQKVYNFDKLGLMLWVWRNKIRTVLISSEED